MWRVQRRPGSASNGSQAAMGHEQGVIQKPKYEVMLEQVTQQKKKLLSRTSFKIAPPAGFTFVPLGESELTNKCKDLARTDGVPVHVVSTSKGGRNATELSKQVGRVGHHFPSNIVSRALTSLGYDLTTAGRLKDQFEAFSKSLGNEAPRKEQKGLRVGEGITDPAQLKKEQEKLNNNARLALKVLFPKMPDKDIKSVVKHAFTIGKDRIGSSAEVSIDRRVHLAVLAHIRHSYTKYDELLKEFPYQTARSIVEPDTLRKIVEWRGEDDSDDSAVEDILREVIVIPDDEESDDDASTPNGDEARPELVSTIISADQVNPRPVDFYRGRPVYDSPQTHRMPQHGPQRYRRLEDPDRLEHERVYRQSAWRDVKRQFRPVDNQNPVPHGYVSQIVHHDRRPPAPTLAKNGQGPLRDPNEEPRQRLDEEYSRQVHVPRAQVILQEAPRLLHDRDRGTELRQVGPPRDAAVIQRDARVDAPDQRFSRRVTPPRKEIIHQSIESPLTYESRQVIVLDSPRERRPDHLRQQQAPSSGEQRYSGVAMRGDRIPQDVQTVQRPYALGKRMHDDLVDDNLPPSKAQRVETRPPSPNRRPMIVPLPIGGPRARIGDIPSPQKSGFSPPAAGQVASVLPSVDHGFSTRAGPVRHLPDHFTSIPARAVSLYENPGEPTQKNPISPPRMSHAPSRSMYALLSDDFTRRDIGPGRFTDERHRGIITAPVTSGHERRSVYLDGTSDIARLPPPTYPSAQLQRPHPDQTDAHSQYSSRYANEEIVPSRHAQPPPSENPRAAYGRQLLYDRPMGHVQPLHNDPRPVDDFHRQRLQDMTLNDRPTRFIDQNGREVVVIERRH